jgi:hypothetical protein
MDEAHCFQYSIHLRTHKMYQDLKKNFWWTRMKREIARYVAEWDTCWWVKADHLRPTGNLQPLSIPEWKWEGIYMDFIVGLPRTSCGHDSIWVIVDRMTKSAHFIPVGTRYRVRQYAELYMSHIICYHGISKTIISDKDYFCCAFLGTITWVSWYPSYPELSLSSLDWRSDRASQPNHWRYAPHPRPKWWSEMGPTPSTSWVVL